MKNLLLIFTLLFSFSSMVLAAENTVYYSNNGPTDVSGLQPGQDFQTVIRRFRSICGSCKIEQVINNYWTLYTLYIKGDLVFIVVGMRQEKGPACFVRYVVYDDPNAARSLIREADKKFGSRISYPSSEPKISLEYRDDMNHANFSIRNEKLCGVKVKL